MVEAEYQVKERIRMEGSNAWWATRWKIWRFSELKSYTDTVPVLDTTANFESFGRK